jgi:hypothetical protein
VQFALGRLRGLPTGVIFEEMIEPQFPSNIIFEGISRLRSFLTPQRDSRSNGRSRQRCFSGRRCRNRRREAPQPPGPSSNLSFFQGLASFEDFLTELI